MGSGEWAIGIKPDIITADQILRCRIAKPRGWKNGMRSSFWIGTALASLLANPDEADADSSCPAIYDFSIWWMTCCYAHCLNDHAMHLVEQSMREQDAAIEVVIHDATLSGVEVSTVRMESIGERYFCPKIDAPIHMPAQLADIECPPAHTRVFFIAPSVRVVIAMVAEMEGLQ